MIKVRVDNSVVTLPTLKGTDGKSAYEYAVDAGYKGSEEEFSTLLVDNSNAINEHLEDESAHSDIRESINTLESKVDNMDVDAISNHNVSTDAHADIRELIESLQDDIVNSDFSEAIDEHDASEDSHADIRESINTLSSKVDNIDVTAQVNAGVSTHNTDGESHSDIRESIGVLQNKVDNIDVTAQVNAGVSSHNTDSTAHNDIRDLINVLQSEVDAIDYTDDINSTVSGHNVATDAHNDIRGLITELQNAINDIDVTGGVNTGVSTHNVATDAHNDIRLLISGLTDRLNALANSDDDTLDQMKEVVDYIKANRELIESVTTTKVNVSDIIDNLTTNVGDRPLSAAQGVVLKGLLDTLQATVDSKSSDLNHTTNTDIHVSPDDKTNWNNAAFGTSLSTSILDYALSLGIGVFKVYLSGDSYTGEDLPNFLCAYGSAIIVKRNVTTITVLLTGNGNYPNESNLYYNMSNGTSWHGWKELVDSYNFSKYAADKVHTHEIADVNGLQTALNGKTQRVDLSGQLQQTSYRRSVIALCHTNPINTGASSFSSGKLSVRRSNGLDDCNLIIDLFIGEEYYSDYGISASISETSFTSYNDVVHARPCTFSYNGVTYGGIELFVHDANSEIVVFDGCTNFPIFGLDYFDTENNVPLNEEVYNSLNFDNVTYSKELYHNLKKVYTEDNLKVGGRNLLDGTYFNFGHVTNTDDNKIKMDYSTDEVVDIDHYFFVNMYEEFILGEEYTISFDVENLEGDLSVYIGNTSNVLILKNGRVSKTFVANGGYGGYLNRLIIDDTYDIPRTTRSNNILLSNFKLEKGNVATDYTPAPEDKADKVHTHEISDVNGLQDIADNNQYIGFNSTQPGWYRFAEYIGSTSQIQGSSSNGCEIIIKRNYVNAYNEEHKLLLQSTFQHQKFVSIYNKSNEDSHIITKIRYVYTSDRAYLDVYHSLNAANWVTVTLNNGKDILNTWKVITATLVEETTDGETVTTVYDIPANTDPVNSLDLENTLNTTTQRRYEQIIDLTDTSVYDENTWYPCIGNGLPLRQSYIGVNAYLGSSGVPSWSTHTNGFNCALEMLAKGSGWGSTYSESICLNHSVKFTADNIFPCSYTQIISSSVPVFWLRGGGKYYTHTEYPSDWAIITTSYEYGGYTVSPQSSCPEIDFSRSTIHANLSGHATTSTTADNANKLLLQSSLNTAEEVDTFNNPNEFRVATVNNYTGIGWVSGDGAIISIPCDAYYDGKFGSQIAIDDQTNFMAFRTKSNGTWNSWVEMLHTGNFKNTNNTAIGIDDVSANGIMYTADVNLFGQYDGALYKQVYSDAWAAEIFQDYRTGQICTRGKNNGTWQEWRAQLDSLNFQNYITPAHIGAAPAKRSIYESASTNNTELRINLNLSSIPESVRNFDTLIGYVRMNGSGGSGNFYLKFRYDLFKNTAEFDDISPYSLQVSSYNIEGSTLIFTFNQNINSFYNSSGEVYSTLF